MRPAVRLPACDRTICNLTKPRGFCTIIEVRMHPYAYVALGSILRIFLNSGLLYVCENRI